MSSRESIGTAGEDGLLSSLGPLLRRHTAGFPLPTGDDVAVTAAREPRRMAWTIDSMIEGTHFRWWSHREATPEALGHKLAASNLSDLAAKGARPLHALLSLGVPPETSVKQVGAFVEGLAAALEAHGARLAGGDTVDAPCWMLTLSLTGELSPKAGIAARSNARPGHVVYTTGHPGESAAGFHLLECGAPSSPAADHLILRHLRPAPRLDVGRLVAEELRGAAMIDLSDGVARDAARVAQLSSVRIVLERELFPLSPQLRAAASEAGRDPVEWFLHGGEDYELLFTTDAPEERVLALSPLVRRIGRVEAGSGLLLSSGGSEDALDYHGYQHFQRSPPPSRRQEN